MTNRTLQKSLFQVSTSLIALSVILGAFGAHGLKGITTPALIDTFKTAVQYQFIHAAGLLILSLNLRRLKEKTISRVYTLFILGIVLFSGSLYFLTVSNIIGLSAANIWLAAATPIGGVCFIAGWALLAYKGYKPHDGTDPVKKQHSHPRTEPARNAA